MSITKPTRLIARLDIKSENLIKGIHLEGLRVIGNPQEFATKYYREGIDELIYMDTVASLYGRNNLSNIVEYTCEHIFVPMTVGGGVRSLADVEKLLRAGADKVAINTAAIARPSLIQEVAKAFGAQCMVISIEAKRQPGGGWEAYTDNGRERTGRDVLDWAKQAVDLGAGEILLTSVDQEGTRQGFDVTLVRAVTAVAPVPVIASGGMGNAKHLADVVQQGGADAVAMADILHYKRKTIADIRSDALQAGVTVRTPEAA
ncbi:MAG: imidazole glycerol phosphate synthase cyclase subunit [Rickettsiales bacterium]|nr:imidazole glycerol phosphate synthase cyclase subunit [Rickettsiales bacterium]